jgi:hypothetical protein
MAEHTPGPWKVGDDNGIEIFDPSDPDLPWYVADVFRSVQKPVDGLANARLIAKSPEMFALLESFANDFAHDGDSDERCHDTCRACRAAELLQEIEKATTP